MTGAPAYSIAPDVAWRIVGGEVFAVTIDGLSHDIDRPSGVAIWQLLDAGPATLDQVVAMLVEQFKVDSATARTDAAEFLSDLQKKSLVSVSAE